MMTLALKAALVAYVEETNNAIRRHQYGKDAEIEDLQAATNRLVLAIESEPTLVESATPTTREITVIPFSK